MSVYQGVARRGVGFCVRLGNFYDRPMDIWSDLWDLQPYGPAGSPSSLAHSLIVSPTVVLRRETIKTCAGNHLTKEAAPAMTQLSHEMPEPPEPDDAPETPPDEPKPVPVQDPPAEPNQTPYVVLPDHAGQQERE